MIPLEGEQLSHMATLQKDDKSNNFFQAEPALSDSKPAFFLPDLSCYELI